MFLSGTFLGLSTLKYIDEGTNIPLRRVYSKCRVYGNATVDKLHIKNIEMSNEEIANIIITDDLIWDVNTLLMAEFKSNLVAGNISEIMNPIINWQVNRREADGTTLKVLKTLGVSETEFIDYTCQQGKKYVYSNNALADNEMSEPLEAEEIETYFYGYYLVSEEEGVVYKFDLNIQSGTKQYEDDTTIMNNYTEYPSIAMGKRRYFNDTVSCICGEINIDGKLLQNVDYIDTLREFILNGKQKLWKTRKGQIYRIFTSGFQETVLDDGIGEQPLIVSFNITQVGDV